LLSGVLSLDLAASIRRRLKGKQRTPLNGGSWGSVERALAQLVAGPSAGTSNLLVCLLAGCGRKAALVATPGSPSPTLCYPAGEREGSPVP
jgi:hypothetical protein